MTIPKQSCLGPIDPQIGGIPADVVVTEFKRAFEEIRSEPMKAHVWAPILSRYTPSFLSQCEYAVAWSGEFVQTSLEDNMLADHANKQQAARTIVEALSSAAVNKAHNKHIHSEQLRTLGVAVEVLEANQSLQDAVLTVHHCYMHTLASTSAIKIVENDDGRAVVRHMAQPMGPQQISIGFGGPT